MPNPRQRNSRDDKSRATNGPKTDRSDRKDSFKVRSSDAPDRPYSTDKKSFGPEKKRPYSSQREDAGDRKPRTFSKDRSDAPKRPYSTDRKPYDSDNKRPYSPKREDAGDRKPRTFSKDRSDAPKRPYSTDRKPYDSDNKRPYSPKREDAGDRKPRTFSKDRSDAPKRPYSTDRKPYDSDNKRPYSPKREDAGDRKPRTFSKDRSDAPKRPFSTERKPYDSGNKRPFKREEGDYEDKRPRNDRYASERGYKKDFSPRKPAPEKEKLGGKGRKTPLPSSHDDGSIRLNRYIANAGICSRRKADELIAAGVVTVNGEAVSELGHRVNPAKDVIRYNGETLKREKMVYVLLNKPKDYITTTDDPQERRTVMSLVEKASKERIYPIGRLDRNTTGLLLMTNDGDLADKLSHPKNNVTKIYQVELNKSLSQGDLNKILFGLELEDGFIKPDTVSYVQGATKKEIGIQIHSGKNRIVRRIFEHLGYDVVKLDRVVYANLTKKDLTRGRWRYLEEKEVIQLKHLIK